MPVRPLIFATPDDRGTANLGGRLGSREAPLALAERLKKLRFPLDYEMADFSYTPSEDILGDHLKQAENFPTKTFSSLVHWGGSHNTLIALMALLINQKTGKIPLINIDPHADVRPWNTNMTSGSGIRYILETWGDRIDFYWLAADPMSNDLTEYSWLAKHPSTKLVHHRNEMIPRLQLPGSVLSVCMDVVDVAYAPGVSAPAVGGFTNREILQLVRELSEFAHHLGIYEIVPNLDPGLHTILLGARLTAEFIKLKNSQ